MNKNLLLAAALIAAAATLCVGNVSAAIIQVDVTEGVFIQPSPFSSLRAADSDLGDSWSKNFGGGVGVDIDAVGSSLDDRDRSVNGADPFLLRDFVFANPSTNSTQGLDVLITGLLADTEYPITLWSWDKGSGGNRVSDWFANDNGGSFVEKVSNYTFNGNNSKPTTLAERRMDFTIFTSPAGAITIRGLGDDGPSGEPAVFLNGLVVGDPIVVVPEPSTYLFGALFGLLLFGYRRRLRA